MKTCTGPFYLRPVQFLAIAALVAWAPLRSLSAENDTTPPAEPAPATNNVDALQANRQMLENLQREIETQVARHTEAITSSLMQIEPALNRIRDQQAEASANANRTILVAAGLFAVAGFFGLGFLTLASVRAMGRFSEVAVTAATRRQLPGPGETSAAPAEGDYKSIVSGTVERASARFQGALEQLERRILELEHTSHPSTANPPGPAATHTATATATATAAATPQGNGNIHPLPENPATTPSRVEMQLGKGQALLNLDQATQALECFESALAEEPNHTDALVKKGMALEKLQDWDRALECYDRAITLDDSLTVAFLYKGGICNRLERHREALECYEQALLSERKRSVS